MSTPPPVQCVNRELLDATLRFLLQCPAWQVLRLLDAWRQEAPTVVAELERSSAD